MSDQLEEKGQFTFKQLVESIQDIHREFAAEASRAVNTSLTLRNWMIGWYIWQFEQNGSDRAEYGEYLIPQLSRNLTKAGLVRVSDRELRRFRQFCFLYPQIRETVSPEFNNPFIYNHLENIEGSKKVSNEIRETASPELVQSAKLLLHELSFSHFIELIKIEEPLKRLFYEVECIKGGWSVRELRRQISSLYFERAGLSKDKKKLSQKANEHAEHEPNSLAIRDPYIFEFLGLRPCDALEENDLEAAIVENLQQFLMELGHGFCFEARQKRILIGENYYFIDLVFYHRILKCHVLIEMKVGEFSYEYTGQLNTYLNWYKKHEMSEGDNPPIGLLLCTNKDNALAEYALAGMDNKLFVSKYQLNLPDQGKIQDFLRKQVSEAQYRETRSAINR